MGAGGSVPAEVAGQGEGSQVDVDVFAQQLADNEGIECNDVEEIKKQLAEVFADQQSLPKADLIAKLTPAEAAVVEAAAEEVAKEATELAEKLEEAAAAAPEEDKAGLEEAAEAAEAVAEAAEEVAEKAEEVAEGATEEAAEAPAEE